MPLYRFDKKYVTRKDIENIETQDTTNEEAIASIDAAKVDKDGGVFIVPTTDPAVVGALWNNSGTLTISAG